MLFDSTLANALQTVDRFKIRSPGSISGVPPELLAVWCEDKGRRREGMGIALKEIDIDYALGFC